MSERQTALRKVQTLDFALLEAVHYLNAHPHCAEALEYCKQVKKEAIEARKAYECEFSPVTMYGENNSDCWEWVMSPWPWECEAN